MADKERRVRITGGMAEFVGKIGTAKWKEMGMWRVFLDEPVTVSNVGVVRDDLWDPCYLKTIRGR